MRRVPEHEVTALRDAREAGELAVPSRPTPIKVKWDPPKDPRDDTRHGLGYPRGTGKQGPTILQEAERIREFLVNDYGEIIGRLSLPTVDLICQTVAEANMYHDVVMAYAEGRRRNKGKTGIEACPMWIAQESTRSRAAAAKMLQDIGLDLTGRARALKDDAIARSLNQEMNMRSQLAGSSKRFRMLK